MEEKIFDCGGTTELNGKGVGLGSTDMPEFKVEPKEKTEQKPIEIPIKISKKVAIVGTSDTMQFAPYDDPTWDIWGVNNGFLKMKRWTHWFELHRVEFDGMKWTRREGKEFRGMPVEMYLQSLDSLKVPVFMQKPNPLIKMATPFPYKELMDFFGTKYFTNTISWEIGFALWLAMRGLVDELGVYGVDMATTSGPDGTQEYGSQRPSCEFFLGMWNMWAKINNKKPAHLPDACDLLKSRYIYGLQELEEDTWNKKCMNTIQAMSQRLGNAQVEEQRAHDKVQQYLGGMSAIKDMARNWGLPGVNYGRSS